MSLSLPPINVMTGKEMTTSDNSSIRGFLRRQILLHPLGKRAEEMGLLDVFGAVEHGVVSDSLSVVRRHLLLAPARLCDQ